MNCVRGISLCLALATALAGVPGIVARADDAVPNQTIHISADRIAFYYDRFLIEADGHVKVTTSDGLTVTGETFSMDLKLDRFLVAGQAHLTSPTGAQSGAAVADYLAQNRVYFVPITTEPDRWTFVDGDYAHPLKGRVMPGDPFEFPDLGDAKPFLLAKTAIVRANTFVRFGGTQLLVAGASAPLGQFYIGFSANPNLVQNSLSGATYDATYQFAGNANSISALHVRYDPQNKAYLAFEQHLVSSNAYAVFSVNPATRPSKFWNLVTAYKPNARFQLQDYTQLHTFQFGLAEPLEAQTVSTVTVTQVLGTPRSPKDGALSLSFRNVNYCLLQATPTPLCGAAGHQAVLDNFSTTMLGAASSDYRFTPYFPLTIRGRAGFDLNHDTQTLQVFGNTPYTSVWDHYIGATVQISHVGLGNIDIPDARRFFFDFSLDGERQWYSVPHHVDTVNGFGSIRRQINQSLLGFVSYQVVQTSDLYNAGQQVAYPSYTPTIGSQSFPSYAAFQGEATLRTLTLFLDYVPNPANPDFFVAVTARKHRDFPIPEPGLFPLPLTDVLGNPLSTNYLGQPPYDVTGELHFRVMPHMSIDIQRTYYFNFGTQRWSPNFIIQVLQ